MNQTANSGHRSEREKPIKKLSDKDLKKPKNLKAIHVHQEKKQDVSHPKDLQDSPSISLTVRKEDNSPSVSVSSPKKHRSSPTSPRSKQPNSTPQNTDSNRTTVNNNNNNSSHTTSTPKSNTSSHPYIEDEKILLLPSSDDNNNNNHNSNNKRMNSNSNPTKRVCIPSVNDIYHELPLLKVLQSEDNQPIGFFQGPDLDVYNSNGYNLDWHRMMSLIGDGQIAAGISSSTYPLLQGQTNTRVSVSYAMWSDFIVENQNRDKSIRVYDDWY